MSESYYTHTYSEPFITVCQISNKDRHAGGEDVGRIPWNTPTIEIILHHPAHSSKLNVDFKVLAMKKE